MKKQNCWEVKNCGKGLLGNTGRMRDLCPAAVEQGLNGAHGGRNAGRACWIVSGTLCGGDIQGTYSQKYRSCMACNFYKSVMKEEGVYYMSSLMLLDLLKVSRGIRERV